MQTPLRAGEEGNPRGCNVRAEAGRREPRRPALRNCPRRWEEESTHLQEERLAAGRREFRTVNAGAVNSVDHCEEVSEGEG